MSKKCCGKLEKGKKCCSGCPLNTSDGKESKKRDKKKKKEK